MRADCTRRRGRGMDEPSARRAADTAVRAPGVLWSRRVRRDTGDGPEATLVLVATPDFDIAGACAWIGRTHDGSWPPVVVLAAPPGDGGPPDTDEADLRRRLAQVTRAADTVALRREFL